jgi:Ca-activated chloride channel homolog
MSGRTILAATHVAFLNSSSSAQNQFQSVDLVDVDVVVTDGEGKPVTGLKKDDFQVREDGKPVELKTFVPVATSEDSSTPRSMVILLDDVTMPTETVNAVKALATYLALQARPIDDLAVIRFRNKDDEPFGDRRAALARIQQYEGAKLRYAPAGAPEDVLRLIASVAKKLEPAGRRRKILVCIGAPRICAIREPGRFAGGWFYGDWAAAVSSAARANLSMYSVLAAPARFSGEGIVEATGGTVFRNASDFRPLLDRIWQDAGHHYLLGYWPPTSSKDLHTISVTVGRKGVHVLARRQRGN